MTGPRYSIIPAMAVIDERLSSSAIRVLNVVGSHSGNNGCCVLRQSVISQYLGISRSTVSESIRTLVECGYIRIIQRHGQNGARLANLYQVVMDQAPDLSAEDESEVFLRSTPAQPVGQGAAGHSDGGCPASRTGGTRSVGYLLPSEDNDLFLERPLSSDSTAPGALVAVQSPNKAPSAKSTPFSEMAKVLDDERARAVVDHRQKIRKPLTVHAARLLAAKFAETTDPNAAADLMIERGWQGFDPAWVATRGRTEAPRQMSLAEHAVRKLARMRDGEIDGQ